MPCGKRAAARRGTPNNPTGAAACFHPTHSLSAPGPGYAAGSPVPENATRAFPVRQEARSPPRTLPHSGQSRTVHGTTPAATLPQASGPPQLMVRGNAAKLTTWQGTGPAAGDPDGGHGCVRLAVRRCEAFPRLACGRVGGDRQPCSQGCVSEIRS